MNQEDVTKHKDRLVQEGKQVLSHAIPVVQSGLCLLAHFTAQAAEKLQQTAEQAVVALNKGATK